MGPQGVRPGQQAGSWEMNNSKQSWMIEPGRDDKGDLKIKQERIKIRSEQT